MSAAKTKESAHAASAGDELADLDAFAMSGAGERRSDLTVAQLLSHALGVEGGHRDRIEAVMLHQLARDAHTWAGVFLERTDAEASPDGSTWVSASSIAEVFHSFQRRLEVVTELMDRRHRATARAAQT